MAIELIGIDRILKRFDTMDDTIYDFGNTKMFDELLAWQAEDMKRQFPNAKQDDAKTVFTNIWPRSRLSQQRRPKLFTKAVRKVVVKQPATGLGRGVLRMAHPILRPELFTKLCERMSKLMTDNLVWKK